MLIDLNIQFKRFKKSTDDKGNTSYDLLPLTNKQAGHGSLVQVTGVDKDKQDAYETATNQHLLASKELRIYDFKYNEKYKQLSGVAYVANAGSTTSVSVEVDN
tara:strand:+ start:708 stop:1016 length:309 start_codon:yes stop_codon:yes gene_type:complete